MHASAKDVKLNISSRRNEPNSLTKSDADLSIFRRYQELMGKFPVSLKEPINAKYVNLSSRSPSFGTEINRLAKEIINSEHRLIILGGNVLTGKTYTARKLKLILKDSLVTD